jgi:hypothetical protein
LCRRHGIDLPIANIGATALRTRPIADVLTVGNFATPDFCVDPSPYRLTRFSDGSAIRRPEMM